MPRSLHPNANLEVLKKQAKELLNAHKLGDSTCCQVLRTLHRFTDKTDTEILESGLKLTDVQYALAMDYGFNSWSELRRNLGANQNIVAKQIKSLGFEGNGQNRDSVALAMVAAAKVFDQSLEYSEVSSRLGNAFGPAINAHENCTSHMQVEGRLLDRGLPTAGKQLGFRVERLEFSDRSVSPDVEDTLFSRRQMVAARVAPLLSDGTVVLVTGGWQVDGGPHGFRHWGYAGFLTSVNQAKGFLLGAHPQGQIDNPLVSICQNGMVLSGERLYAWALRPAAEAHPDDVGTLRMALDRIRGTGVFESDSDDLFGLAAMDFWIDIMRRDEGFCVPCWGRRDKDAGKPADAWDNAMRLRQSSIDASGFLEGCIDRLGESVRPHLAAAVRAYDAIVDLLAGSVLWDGRKSYQTILGDLRLQQEHADSVLVPAREALLEAAYHLEIALTEV